MSFTIATAKKCTAMTKKLLFLFVVFALLFLRCGSEACKTGRDCDSTMLCEQGFCVPRSCTPESCPAGEVCVQGQVCVRPFSVCKDNGDCAPYQQCMHVGNSNGPKRCIRICAPVNPKHYDPNFPQYCWEGWGICRSRGHQNNRLPWFCVPPQPRKRKEGESCDHMEDVTSLALHDCEEGLTCVLHRCVADCDPSKGVTTNPGCPEGSFCSTKKSGYPIEVERSLCLPLPPRPLGRRIEGKCHWPDDCNGGRGLYCSYVYDYGYCQKACNPRRGTENNLECGPGKICTEDSRSFAGGRCDIAPTQGEGEECSGQRLCKGGLVCSKYRCHQRCSKKLPDCPQGQQCNSSDYCLKRCDIKDPKSCPMGWSCILDNSTPICVGTPPFSSDGTLPEGATCGVGKEKCDGQKQLGCYWLKCHKACAPQEGKKQNPKCKPSEECVVASNHPLGGVCLSIATQRLHQKCNETLRCKEGLNCIRQRCRKPCDQNMSCGNAGQCVTETNPAFCRIYCETSKGFLNNPDCGEGAACSGSGRKGSCFVLPDVQEGTATLGERCRFGDNNYPYPDCDGKQGFHCYKGACAKSCNPKNSAETECGSQSKCIEEAAMSTGGRCETLPTQELGEQCNSVLLCKSHLNCLFWGYCGTSCEQKSPTCPEGYECTELYDKMSACRKVLKKIRGKHEGCHGVPWSEDFHHCKEPFVCIQYTYLKGYCAERCNGTCPEGFVCKYYRPGKSLVCMKTCKTLSDCNGLGTRCSDNLCY